MTRIRCFTPATMLLTGPVFAADIATDVRSGIGVAAGYLTSPRVIDDEGWEVGLSLAGGYRYKGFFVEASQGTFDGLNLGYNFWNNQHWTADLLASSFNGTLDTDNADTIDGRLTEAQQQRQE